MNEATPHSRGAPAALREISIPALVQTVRRGLWLLIAVVILCVLATAIDFKLSKPLYTASMIVAPAEIDFTAASQLTSEVEQFAGLATLGQSPVKIERVSNLERYAQLFGSTALAARLQAERDLLQTIFVDEWDKEHQTWHPPGGFLARIGRTALRFFGYPAWTPPDLTRLADWLGDQVYIQRIGSSALFRIQINDPRPTFAVSLIAMMHHAADGLLREETLDRIGRQIRQAESDLAAATTATRRQALEALLSEQYQAQALLSVEQPYAAQVVVPATVSPQPTSLNPLLALALAAVIGLIIGLFVVFLHDALRGGEAR